MIEEIVGIDLGTTNSEIAVYRNGRAEVLADERGRKILPSVVGVAETGDLLVGEDARNQFVLYPERTTDQSSAGWAATTRSILPGPRMRHRKYRQSS
jgi:molecular chaperone DnaK (HSP70)